MNGEIQRIFEHRCLWHMTPATYLAGTELLTKAAVAQLGEVATVIGIANGGRAPAYAIAAQTGGSVVTVTARHNPDDSSYLQATGQVQCDPAPLLPLHNQPGPFLIVDDICGTGATLDMVTTALTGIAAPEAAIRTATLCRNLGAAPGTPDLYVWDVADWVVFPWEPNQFGIETTPLPTPTEVHRA